MPQDQSILGLSGFEIKKVEGISPTYFTVVSTEEVTCPHCQGGRVRKKARYERRVRHVNRGKHRMFLQIEAHKYRCQNCGRYFNQRFPMIGKYRRSTTAFRRHLVEQHRDGISQQTLAQQEGIGSSTIERWYQEEVELKWRERQNDPCPRLLGIDEHFFSKKQGYATTFCDLEHRKVFDVRLGRSEKALEGYLKGLWRRDRVEGVCIDLSESYRSMVRKHFPRAKIIADRFHVIRLIQHHFLEVWKRLDPTGRANRGLLSLMRRRPDRLRGDQRERLRAYLLGVPGLRALYDFQQRLLLLCRIKTQTARACRRLLPRWRQILQQLQDSRFSPLAVLGKTLESWSEEIVRMWRFPKNNGITEGFHNKMEMISRRAFGFRNFENYRLRVKVLCS